MRVRLRVDLTVDEIGGSAVRSVHTPVGMVDGRPGDLIVQDPDGDCWVMPRRKFEKFCRRLEAEGDTGGARTDTDEHGGGQ